MPIVPISFSAHARTKIRPLSSFAFAARTPIVPLYMSELVAFSHELPVVFLAEGEHMTPAALLGLRPGSNLMIGADGSWLGSHVPGVWRRDPFRIARIEGREDFNMMLCLDDSSDRLNETEGHPLFAEDGTPTPLIDAAKKMLVQFEHDVIASRSVCAELQRLGMIIPWPLEVQQPDGTKQQLSGIFRVDETKIHDLSGDDLAKLRDVGALPVIYAHLLSLTRINLLARLAQHAAHQVGQRDAVKGGTLDLDRAFGIVEDDPFIF